MDDIAKKLSGIIEKEPLANHTTFKIGGPAKYFYSAKNSADLLKSVKAAEELKIPYLILGWGSNILVSDEGFDGLVIKTVSDNFETRGNDLWAEAGVNLSRLVGAASQARLSGLEFAAGIPGSVGGAASGNAGAYGSSFGDIVKELEVYENGKVIKISREEMKYAYRESRLKHGPGLIVAVTVSLMPGDQKKIQGKVLENIKNRKDKLPFEPSAGCIFKNIELNNLEYDSKRVLKELEIDEEEWLKVTAHGKLPSAYLIDKLGLKGKIVGGCKVSEKHSAFFINIGNCRAEHVMILISEVKMRVRNRLGIQLSEEIKFIGF